MNKQTEALKMAIEALQNNQVYDCEGKPMLAIEEANEKAIQACKEALEQPAQEPVAWLSTNSIANEVIKSCSAPSWQGLSDDEIQNILACNRGEFVAIKKAEQLLKDKNGR